MTSSQHSRGRIMFEVLCIWALGGSFGAAWLQTGVTAHLASAAIAAVFGLSWSLGLFARRPVDAEAPLVPMSVGAEARNPATQNVDHADYAPPRIEIFAFEPEEMIEPEPVVEPKPVKQAKPKRRKKAAPTEGNELPVVEQPEVAAFDEPAHHEVHIEPLFEPQPFVRQARAFGRKARGAPPLPAA